VFGHLLLGLIDLAAGVVALVWPAPTAFVLVIVVAAWALAGGIADSRKSQRASSSATSAVT
jgi:uncharacterized membrane protein HdeD (DUF308 family)